jgi:hypothetical protein
MASNLTRGATPHSPQLLIANGVTILAGLWLIVSSFVLNEGSIQVWLNSIVFGVVVAVLATIMTFSRFESVELSWVNLILGLWIIIAPFVFRASSSSTIVADVITGIVIAALAAWSAMSSRRPAALTERPLT